MTSHNFAFACESSSIRPVNDLPSMGEEYWAHFSRDLENVPSIENLGLNHHLVMSLVDETTRPHFDKVDEQRFLLFLRAINLNKDSEPEDMVSLRLCFDGKHLITVMNRKLQAVKTVREKAEHDDIELSNPSDIFVELIHQVLVRIEMHVQHLTLKIEELEETLDEGKEIAPAVVHDLRRATSRMWRHMHPQLDTFKRLESTEFAWQSESFKHSLHEFVESMTYYNEELALIRERCDILNAELTGRINNKVNRNLYLISIITLVFLPLSFITGLLGINVGGIPLAESSDGFLIVSGIIVGIGILQVIIFKLSRWV